MVDSLALTLILLPKSPAADLYEFISDKFDLGFLYQVPISMQSNIPDTIQLCISP